MIQTPYSLLHAPPTFVYTGGNGILYMFSESGGLAALFAIFSVFPIFANTK